MGERLRKPGDRELGGRVHTQAGVGDQAANRGRVDNVAGLAARDHFGQEGPKAVDDAVQVHAEKPIPLLAREVPSLARHLHAGVVAENVDRAQALPGQLGQLLDLIFLGHVDPGAKGLDARLGGQPFGGLSRRRLADVGDQHPHAGRGKGARQRVADSARGPGYDRVAAGELVEVDRAPAHRAAAATGAPFRAMKSVISATSAAGWSYCGK